MRRDPAIIFLAIGQTLAWASIYYVFPALLLRWEQELGWSKAELTAAIALAVLVSAAASPWVGRIIDAGRGGLLVGGSAVLGGFGLFALSIVETVAQFYSVWLTIGLAMAGCLYEPAFALVTRARGNKAKRGIILITLVAGFASTISYPLVYSLAELLGWRGALQILALIMLVIVAPILWAGVRKLEVSTHVHHQVHDGFDAARSYLRKPAFWSLGLGFTCLAVTHGAALHHLLPILDERGLSAEMAILAASFIGPMQVAGRVAMMASERHLSNHRIAIAAFGLMGLSILALMMSAQSPAFVTAFVILFGSSYGTVSILRPLLARDILGEANFGAKSGALAFPYLAGSALSPYVGALIWNFGGYALMLGVMVVVVSIGCALYGLAARLAVD